MKEEVKPFINELYVSKRITLVIPYRGKPKQIKYYIAGFVTPHEDSITFKLSAIKSPYVVPKNMKHIEITLENDFATKKIKNQ
jgi:hypothetical protein